MDDDDRAHVVTLVAGDGFALTAALIDRVRARVFGAEPDVLAPGRAVDIPCEGRPALDRLRRALDGAPVDLFATPAAGRRKRLLVADMDGTVVREETLDELARRAGAGEAVAAITRLSMDGAIDFAEALRQRVATLRGLPLASLEDTWRDVTLNPGARSLVATMRASGATTALVSGGFSFFTGRVAASCGFDIHHSNTLVDDGERLTGAVTEPILDRDAKRAALLALADAAHLPPDATLAVGDGANDLAMLAAAGLGIGYRPKPVVAAAIAHRVEHADLLALLYAQGFHHDEIVAAG